MNYSALLDETIIIVAIALIYLKMILPGLTILATDNPEPGVDICINKTMIMAYIVLCVVFLSIELIKYLNETNSIFIVHTSETIVPI